MKGALPAKVERSAPRKSSICTQCDPYPKKPKLLTLNLLATVLHSEAAALPFERSCQGDGRSQAAGSMQSCQPPRALSTAGTGHLQATPLPAVRTGQGVGRPFAFCLSVCLSFVRAMGREVAPSARAPCDSVCLSSSVCLCLSVSVCLSVFRQGYGPRGCPLCPRAV